MPNMEEPEQAKPEGGKRRESQPVAKKSPPEPAPTPAPTPIVEGRVETN